MSTHRRRKEIESREPEGSRPFAMDVALIVLTAGLFVATAVLAWFTRELAQHAQTTWQQAQDTRREMEQARHLSVRPLLTFDPHVRGGMIGGLLLRNVGRGPALNVRLRLTFEGPSERRDWAERSVVPGESHQFNLPDRFLRNVFVALDEPLTIVVSGHLEDLYGRPIDVAETIDVSSWVRMVEASGELVLGRRKLPGVDVE
jgi:hypothetical protein